MVDMPLTLLDSFFLAVEVNGLNYNITSNEKQQNLNGSFEYAGMPEKLQNSFFLYIILDDVPGYPYLENLVRP